MYPSHRPPSNRGCDVAVAKLLVASPFRARIMPRLSFRRDHDPLPAANADTSSLDFDFELSWTSVPIRRRGFDTEQIICRRFAKDAIEREICGAHGYVNQPATRRL